MAVEKVMEEKFVVIAGDCGVYSGWCKGGALALTADGRLEVRDARHLRRYTIAGKQSVGSASDLAAFGIEANSGYSAIAPGTSVLLGVRRVHEVSAAARATFAAIE